MGNLLLPYIQKALGAVTPFIKTLSKWASENPNLVATLLLVAAGITGIVLAALGLAVIVSLAQWVAASLGVLQAALGATQTLFGGTWARLEDVFLLAAGAKHAAGSTGGEESHILTEPEIAPHKHAMAYGPESSASSTGFPYGIAAGSATNSAGGRGYESNLGTFSAGGGQPHNNMPPYLAVYTWKRTA